MDQPADALECRGKSDVNRCLLHFCCKIASFPREFPNGLLAILSIETIF